MCTANEYNLNIYETINSFWIGGYVQATLNRAYYNVVRAGIVFILFRFRIYFTACT